MSGETKGLQALVARAAAEPAYMASAISHFARLEDIGVDKVLARIGVPDAHREFFLLCLRPSGVRFAEMMRAVSTRFVLDESALLTLLREVDALSAFTSGHISVVAAGALMAARARPPRNAGTGKKSASKGSTRGKRKGRQDDDTR